MADVTSTTTTVKTVAPAAPKTPTLSKVDLALTATSALVPLILGAMNLVPNPIVAIAAMVLAALWAVLKTYLATKHLDAATVSASVAQLEAAFEKATGKTIPADVKSALEFGAGAAAEAATAAPGA